MLLGPDLGLPSIMQQLSAVLINNVRPTPQGVLTSPPGKCFSYLYSRICWLLPMGTCLTDTKLWLLLVGGISANDYGQRLWPTLPALQSCSHANLAAWVSHPSLMILHGSNTPAQGSQTPPQQVPGPAPPPVEEAFSH